LSVPSSERVLIHLFLNSAMEGAVDQEELSANCGIGRTHVPRTLKPLLDDGLIRETTGRSPGRQRRVKVYSLTEKGALEAKAAHQRASIMEITFVTEEGRTVKDRVPEVLRSVNDRLSSMSRPPIPLSLFLSVANGTIDWSTVSWLSSSMRQTCGPDRCLPEGWAPIVPPPVPTRPFNIQGQLVELDRLMSRERFVVVHGPPSAGKRTLVARWATSKGKNVLWLVKAKGEGEDLLERGSYDLIVIGGEGLMDLGSILRGDPPVLDPRNDGWAADLLNAPMIAIVDTEGDIPSPSLKVPGLEAASFVEEAVNAGVPVSIATALFGAAKGNPGLLSRLPSVPAEELRALSSVSEENAVLKLLFLLRSNKLDER